jgi:uncharacterized protein YjbK
VDGPLEIEIKLALPSEAAHDALVRALGAAGATVTTLRQRNGFFDGPRGELSAARIALRVREERVMPAGEPRTLVTLKGGGPAEGAVHRRVELEEMIDIPLEEVAADPCRLLQSGASPIRELRRILPGLESLVCIGGFENERKRAPVELEVVDAGGAVSRLATLWEIDRTRFDAGPEEYELEVEVPEEAEAGGAGAERILRAVEARLARAGIPWQPQPHSKLGRFRGRTGPRE